METQTNDQAKRRPPWTERELKHFEQRLLEERREALSQMHEFEDVLGTSQEAADGDLSNWRLHMADEGTDTFEREQTFMLASREGRLLWLIDQALRRLYQSPETFGVCEKCGTRMSFERLDTIPYAVRCLNCTQHKDEVRAD